MNIHWGTSRRIRALPNIRFSPGQRAQRYMSVDEYPAARKATSTQVADGPGLRVLA